MNKSLLIIICDFLLISVLALVKFEPSIEETTVNQQNLKAQAAEEMLELLQLSLENENSQRQEVEQTLGQTREALSQTREQLQSKESTLQEVNRNLDRTEAERSQLAESLSQTQSSLQVTLEQKTNLEQSLQQNQEQSKRLQEELRSQQQLVQDRNAALKNAQENLDNLQTQQQQMSTRLQILDTEKQMLQQNLVTAQAEVERARLDAERAQQRSENLAAGVSELAASSSALKEQIQQTQTLSLNAIFKQFEDNRIFIRFNWEVRNIFTTVRHQSAIQSLLLDAGNGIYAVFATTNTPLDDKSARNISAAMKIGDHVYTVTEIGYLRGEAGIAAVQVPADVAGASGLKVFSVASEPLRYSTAVLVSDDQEVYGEIPIRVPPGESGYLEIQTRLFNRLFGEFSPGPGDYVFALTGDLTGIMVRPSRARIINTPQFEDYRKLAPGT